MSSSAYSRQCYNLMATNSLGVMVVVGKICFNTISTDNGDSTAVDTYEAPTEGDSGGILEVIGTNISTDWVPEEGKHRGVVCSDIPSVRQGTASSTFANWGNTHLSNARRLSPDGRPVLIHFYTGGSQVFNWVAVSATVGLVPVPGLGCSSP